MVKRHLIQSKELGLFMLTKYPDVKGQKVTQFLEFWSKRLEGNMTISKSETMNLMLERVATSYHLTIQTFRHRSVNTMIEEIRKFEESLKSRRNDSPLSKTIYAKKPSDSSASSDDNEKEDRKTSNKSKKQHKSRHKDKSRKHENKDSEKNVQKEVHNYKE